MDIVTQDSVLEVCRRPRHFFIDQWYEYSTAVENAQLWTADESTSREREAGKIRKANRRVERWWRKPLDHLQAAPSSEKLAEAKKVRFTPEGKRDRISRSLQALRQPSNIRLTSAEWRHIAEDSDLEDQF